MNFRGIRRRPLLATIVSMAVAAIAGTIALSGCGTGNTPYSPITKTNGVQPSFSLAVSPGSVSAVQGNAATYTVTLTETGGFNSPVTLSASGLPAGAAATFSALTATAGGAAATMTVSTTTVQAEEAAAISKLARPKTRAVSTQVTPLGTSTITVTAAGGGVTQSATAALVVTALPGFSITLAPTSVSVVQGASANYTATVISTGGLTASSLTFTAAAGLPTGAVATFGTPTATASGETVPVTVSTTGSNDSGPVASGSYTITIIGTSNGLSGSASAALIVSAAPTFTITLTPASPGSGIVTPGGTAKFIATVKSVAAFSTPVALTLSGTPQNTNTTFGATTLTPTAAGATTTVNITTSNSEGLETNMGAYPLTLTGSAGSTVHTASATFDVGSFTVTVTEASPGSGTVPQGGTARYIVTLTSVNGFSPSATLTPPALPTGCVATFGSSTITPTATGATTTLSISTSSPGSSTPTPVGDLDFNVGAGGGGWFTVGSGDLVVTSGAGA